MSAQSKVLVSMELTKLPSAFWMGLITFVAELAEKTRLARCEIDRVVSTSYSEYATTYVEWKLDLLIGSTEWFHFRDTCLVTSSAAVVKVELPGS